MQPYEEFVLKLSRLGNGEISEEDCFAELSILLTKYLDSINLERTAIGFAKAGQALRDIAFPDGLGIKTRLEFLSSDEEMRVSCARGIGFFLTEAAFHPTSEMCQLGATKLDDYFDKLGMWPDATFE